MLAVFIDNVVTIDLRQAAFTISRLFYVTISFSCIAGYCPINVCKLQSSYICGEFKNQTKNNEAYNGTKIGNYFGNGLE